MQAFYEVAIKPIWNGIVWLWNSFKQSATTNLYGPNADADVGILWFCSVVLRGLHKVTKWIPGLGQLLDLIETI